MMMTSLQEGSLRLSFYPGCSLATSAKESHQSLLQACQALGVELIEVPDWNCCGSSSAHALDRRLSLELAARNLSLAPPDLPLMAACPSCLKNLAAARLHLRDDPGQRARLEDRWGRSLGRIPEIISFLGLLRFLELHGSLRLGGSGDTGQPLAGLKVAPYYGCMVHLPKALRQEPDWRGMLESSLSRLGAQVIQWDGKHRCCGTFLAASKPQVAAPLIDRIMAAALAAGADCLVTACAMCQLNLEIRCSLPRRLPTLHYSQVLALCLGAQARDEWFTRHLVDPRPLLQAQGLI